jgi:membrane protease YdiL (CAAX protease family)
MDNEQSTPISFGKAEYAWMVAYTVVYMAYLFLSLENEAMHWVSLVLIPSIVIYILQARQTGIRSVGRMLASVGLARATITNGVLWAILIGVALSVLQLFVSRNSEQIIAMFTSGKAVYMYPIGLILIFLTAGFTEEFFFRGVLQTRLQALFASKVIPVLITSFLFGLYHLPYAYFNPRWPSYGDFPDALMAAFGQGIPGGLILGTVYARSKNNLLACVIVHSMINALPAMLVIKFGGS